MIADYDVPSSQALPLNRSCRPYLYSLQFIHVYVYMYVCMHVCMHHMYVCCVAGDDHIVDYV